jgi:hypothetical protein
MFRIFKVIKEIILYREYIKTIKYEAMNSPLWSRRNLRIDYLNRIYTVVNLPAAILMSTDLPKDARPSFVINEIKPTNEYLKSINLEEILTMWIEPIKNTNEESYLVVYQFLFRQISWLWILRFITQLVLIFLIIYNFSTISTFFNSL